MDNTKFESFWVERNDEVENVAHQFLLLLRQAETVDDTEKVLPWNMELIGKLVEDAVSILRDASYSSCWPYNEDNVPCFQTDSCQNPNCPFRQAGRH